MNNPGDFKALISQLLMNDKKARETLIEHIGILMNQWCRKNKLELCWTADGSRIKSSKEVAVRVLNEFTSAIVQDPEAALSYPDYKKMIIKIAGNIISNGFMQFNQLLISGDNNAWMFVNQKLKIYTAKWFYNRKSLLETEPDDLFSSSIALLFEKISSKEMQFNDSGGLKSYFFCIVENKAMESNRKLSAYASLQKDIPEEQFASYSQDENEELILKIQHKINELSELEQHILIHYFWNEKKLNEIAEELRISFENCRVIKHRAIQKIAKSMAVK